jgi:hypothetical protein
MDRNCRIFSSQFSGRTRRDLSISSLSPFLSKMPLLQSATLIASSWPCHQCSHSNDSRRNKKRCSSCQAWRDGLAPLRAKGGGTSTSGAGASDVGLINNDTTCHDENGPPNNVSPYRDESPTKSRGGTKC